MPLATVAELLYAYRRMEARGEIRGGHFVDGFGGDQFAVPQAVDLLREQRASDSKPDSHSSIIISACDSLKLIGTILPGNRVLPRPATVLC